MKLILVASSLRFGTEDFVVELSNPQLSGDDLTYDVRLLEAFRQPTGELAHCSSILSACPLLPCPTPVLRAGPFVAATRAS